MVNNSTLLKKSTYVVDYTKGRQNVIKSLGSPIISIDCARGPSNPATYIDASGIIQKHITSDVERLFSGYWDETGFHLWGSGRTALAIEREKTNFITNSIFAGDSDVDGIANGWDNGSLPAGATPEVVDVSELSNILNSKAQKVTLNGSVGNFFQLSMTISIVSGNVYTISGWIKTEDWTNTANKILEIFGTSVISGGINSSTVVGNDNGGWRFYEATITATGTGNAAVRLGRDTSGTGTGAAYFYGVQVEISPHSTSLIPTTVATLTRNKEVITAPNFLNRTAAVEACVIKVAPQAGDNIDTARVMLDSDTKRREFKFTEDTDHCSLWSNRTDSIGSLVNTLIDEPYNANQQMTLGYNMQSGISPFIACFFDGVADGKDETTQDFIPPEWGDDFYIGCTRTGTAQLAGFIFSIAFFNSVLSAEEHLFLHENDLVAASPSSNVIVELRNNNFTLIKVLNKKISKLSWEYSRIGGCGRCTMILPIDYQELDAFINPDFDIQIKLPNEDNTDKVLVYRGYAESYRPVAKNPDTVTLQFFGYIGQLKRIRINKTYTAQDVNVIVKDIIENFVAPDTKILFDEELINGPSFIIDTITFDETADGALRTLAELSGAVEWGVGSDRNFFFKERSDDINHYGRFKVDVQKLDVINDYSQIINRLIIKGASGFEETVNNTESQSSFGLRTQITSNTAITTSPVAQQYGTTILLEKAAINSRANLTIIDNNRLFEENIPIGRISVLAETIAQAKLYNDDDAIYGQIFYGGQQSFQIDKIKYTLAGSGTNVIMNIGQSRPDIALQIRRLEFEIDQIRNA